MSASFPILFSRTFSFISEYPTTLKTISIFSLLALGKTWKRSRYWVNLGLYVGSLAVSSLCGVVYGVGLSLFGKRLNTNHYVALTFYNLCSPLTGLKLDLEGGEHLEGLGDSVDLETEKSGSTRGSKSAVLVGNHQSFLDILYIGKIMPKKTVIMAKKELKKIPGLGWFMNLSGTIWLNRSNRKDAVMAMQGAAEEMKEKGISVIVFPEGTRSNTPEPCLLPFKKGAFHLAVQAGVPIIPIVCENYHHVFDGKIRFDPGVLRVRVLPPIETKGLTNDGVSDLTDLVRERMLTALKEISTSSSAFPTSSMHSSIESIEHEHVPKEQQDVAEEVEVAQTGEIDGKAGILTGLGDAVGGSLVATPTEEEEKVIKGTENATANKPLRLRGGAIGAGGGGGAGGGKAANQARHKAQNLKYGTPLPILLGPSPLHPDYIAPPVPARFALPEPVSTANPISRALTRTIKRVRYTTASAIIPTCKGVWEPRTRSIWIHDPSSRIILFDRGFFGKGSLSRSDPSWYTRRVQHVAQLKQERQGNEKRQMTSEEVTRARRTERKKFKIERAKAILDASLAAERILQDVNNRAVHAEDDDEEHENTLQRTDSISSFATADQSITTTNIPEFSEYAHALPAGTTRLTPQTFLVRPQRPGQRVKVPRGPRPAPSTAMGADIVLTPEQIEAKQVREREQAAQRQETERAQAELRALQKEVEEDEQVQELEHLQLNLEEAFFLVWVLGVLDVEDMKAGHIFSPLEFLSLVISLPHPSPPSSSSQLSLPNIRRPDNPFLVSYAAYHHYRSLGWVVKTGIKFCADWLLYKKGMVFSHAEFALLVIPNYSEESDKATCPYVLPNADPMTWQWLNTVNRVNTQVKKTLIMAYVTIPPLLSISEEDWRRPEILFGKYAVREVTIRRFVAARMRD